MSGSDCPWCGAPVVDMQAPCAACMRAPAQHPSIVGGADELELDLGSMPPPAPRRPALGQGQAPAADPTALELPLTPEMKRSRGAAVARSPARAGRPGELQAPASRGALAPASAGTRPAAPGAPPSAGHLAAGRTPESVSREMGSTASGVDAFDDWQGESEALEIGLAIDSEPPPSRRGVPSGRGIPDAATGVLPGTTRGLGAMASGAAGPASSRHGLTSLDDPAVLELAGYGPAPTSAFSAVPYAIRVQRRRKQLRAQYLTEQVRHTDLCREAKTKVMAHGRGLRSDVSADMAELFAPVAEAERVIADRANQLAATNDQFAAHVAQVEGDLATMAAERASKEKARNKELIVVEDCEHRYGKIRDELEQLQRRIERLHDDAREAAGAGASFAPPEFAKRIAAAEAERGPTSQRLAEAKLRLDEAKAVLARHDRAIGDVDARLEAVRNRRRGVELEGDAARKLRAQGIYAAEDALLDAYDAVMHRIISESPRLIDDTTRVQIATLDAERDASALRLEHHRLAIDVYDAESYRRGVTVAIVAIAVLVIGLGVLLRLA